MERKNTCKREKKRKLPTANVFHKAVTKNERKKNKIITLCRRIFKDDKIHHSASENER